jgi:NAD+ kinase
MPANATLIRTVGIISRPRREDIARVVPPLIAWLRTHDVHVVCDSETSGCIGALAGDTRERENLAACSDLLIVLGGDGTLLSAARMAVVHSSNRHSPHKVPRHPGED